MGDFAAGPKRGRALRVLDPAICALGALMHKILRIAYGVLKHQTPFVPQLAKL